MSYRNHNSATDSQVLEEIEEENMTLKFEDTEISIENAEDVPDLSKGLGSITIIIHRLDSNVGFVLGPAAVETLAKALSTMSRWGK